MRYSGAGLTFRHAHHIRTLDDALAGGDTRTDLISAARTALDNALASLRQREQDEQVAKKRGQQADAAAAASPSPARAKKRKPQAPAAGDGFDDPLIFASKTGFYFSS